MVPIICVVGASNSGKTTFLEKLIPDLSRRGYRIGTVKHDVHGFEMDREGNMCFVFDLFLSFFFLFLFPLFCFSTNLCFCIVSLSCVKDER